MNISNQLNNMYASNLFTSSTNSSSKSNTYANFISGANYYNTISKYAIAAKYANNGAVTNNKLPSTETQSTTKFLSKFDSKYSDLIDANKKLKEELKDKEINADIVSATKDFITAYNDVTNFLEDYSSSSTSQLNTIKSSHAIASSVDMRNLSSIGISRNSDGTLSLDEKKLTTALSSNPEAVTRTLSSMVNRTEVSTKMANNASKTQLISEQNKSLATSDMNDATYEDFLKLSKNPRALNNYYYSLSTLGIFMDFTI